MKENELKKLKQDKLIMKLCHKCGHCHETHVEPEKCQKCGKAFLPLNYFEKIHSSKTQAFQGLFAESEDLEDEDLIKGLYVLW